MKKKIQSLDLDSATYKPYMTVYVTRSEGLEPYEPKTKIHDKVTPSSAIRVFCAIMKLASREKVK